MNDASSFEVRHVTAAQWVDVERIFDRAGESNGCWCQYWLLGSDYRRRDRSANRLDLITQVRNRHTGLLAYRDEVPVGWARFSPRSELRWLPSRFPTYAFASGDPWTLPCFFTSRRARETGVMTALIAFATAWARQHRATIEAYPIDPAVAGATLNRFTGVVQPFSRSGFTEHGRLTKDRPVMRYEQPD